MILSVHQPQYLPWLGYFDKIYHSDIFVFLDSVQYKDREYQNRNRIRTKDGSMWLTVPVLKNEQAYPNIGDVYIDNTQDWLKRHWRAMSINYAHASSFQAYRLFFEDLYKKEWARLIDLNMYIVESMNKFLGVNKAIYLESQLNIKSNSTQRIIDISKTLKADTYLSGVGGKEYLEEGLFARNGIKLIYQDFKHPQYQQCYEPFISNMSVVDLLFNCGVDALEILIGDNL